MINIKKQEEIFFKILMIISVIDYYGYPSY